MAQPNANSPQYTGPVAAQSFQTLFTGDPTKFPQKVVVNTNGSTPVNVFGSTNGVSGTFTGGVRVTRINTTGGSITLKQNISGTETTVCTIPLNGAQGSMNGTYFAAVAFKATGTATVQESGAGSALVEIDFVVSNPALTGAQ